MRLLDRLQAMARIWEATTGRSLPRLGTIVANDGKIFDRLATGGAITVPTYERFVEYFRTPSNWPAGIIPGDIERLSAMAESMEDESPVELPHDACPDCGRPLDTEPVAQRSSGNAGEISSAERAA